jgi:hypothetical protein
MLRWLRAEQKHDHRRLGKATNCLRWNYDGRDADAQLSPKLRWFPYKQRGRAQFVSSDTPL